MITKELKDKFTLRFIKTTDWLKNETMRGIMIGRLTTELHNLWAELGKVDKETFEKGKQEIINNNNKNNEVNSK